MQEYNYTITDVAGIHARPAGLFVQCMQQFESRITVSKGEKTVDAKKLFALMSLRVKYGETIVVKAEGKDAVAAIEAAKDLLSREL